MGVQFLRPSRRELVLVLLTAGVSFILFAGSQQPKDGASNATWASSVYGSSLGKLADSSKYPSSWSSWLGSESSAPTSCDAGEANFWDSAAQYGTASQPDPKYGLNGPDDDVLVSQEERLLGTHKVGHAPGWTMMERAYVYNGSVYVVT